MVEKTKEQTGVKVNIPDPELLELFGDEPEPESPLDKKIAITIFSDLRAREKRKEAEFSLRDLVEKAKGIRAADKDSMPHIKLGTFGDQKSDNGCYRHNRNHVAVSGIEGDYDAGEVSVDAAVRLLAEAGIAAMIYTTPSHGLEGKGHRWRVLCPLERDVAPNARRALAARLNGALGGIVSDESFTATQSYAFGQVKGASPVRVELVDGRFLDQVEGIEGIDPKGERADRGEPQEAADLSDDPRRVEAARAILERSAERLGETHEGRNAALTREAYLLGGLLANRLLERSEIMDALVPAMTINGYLDDHAKGERAEVERVIDAQLEAGAREPFDPLPDRDLDDLDEEEEGD